MKGKVKRNFCRSNIIVLSLAAMRRTSRRKSKWFCGSAARGRVYFCSAERLRGGWV